MQARGVVGRGLLRFVQRDADIDELRARNPWQASMLPCRRLAPPSGRNRASGFGGGGAPGPRIATAPWWPPLRARSRKQSSCERTDAGERTYDNEAGPWNPPGSRARANGAESRRCICTPGRSASTRQAQRRAASPSVGAIRWSVPVSASGLRGDRQRDRECRLGDEGALSVPSLV
jgi:hypothetical protein